MRLRFLFLLPFLAIACDRDARQTPADGGTGYTTDVIGIGEQHLSADYWVTRLEAAAALVKDEDAIAAMNERAFANDETLVDLASLPERFDAADVRGLIAGLSRRPAAERFHEDGRLLGDEDFDRYTAALDLDALAGPVETRFGLVVRRADMRTFPTRDRVYNAPPPGDIDRFQEHALFPGEGVAILHRSADGAWLFAQSYNYAAWIEADSVALTDRDTMLDYLSAPRFLVVTGSKVHTTYNPDVPAVSELQLDMGTRLPLVAPGAAGHEVHGQNPFTSHVVRLPTRGEAGRLELELALIARSQDVTAGYLPYTKENVIRQSFKFLGERYGWGHSYNGRDCSGLVSEVYKSFGIVIPRNSGDQARSAIGKNLRFTDDTPADEKVRALRDLEPGSLIFIPGHVMMHIGDVDGEPYVIHDVHGLGYLTAEGDFYRGVLAGVSVTPLMPMRLSAETSYVDRIYNVKILR